MPPSDRKRAWRIARVLLGLLCVLGPVRAGVAQEASERELSARGRFLLAGTLGGSWSRDNEGRLGTLTRQRVSAAPSVTYFLRDGIGVGAHLGGGIGDGAGVDSLRRLTEQRAWYAQVGVHGVFDVPLAQRLSLLVWPALAYVHEWIENSLRYGRPFPDQAAILPAYRATQLGYVRVGLNLPIVFQLSSSVAVGLGPELWVDVIVRREPDGTSPQQAANPFPEPAAYRLQVGLSTALVVAL